MTQDNTTATIEAPVRSRDVIHLPSPLVLDFSAVEMTDDQLVKFCADNGDLRIELTAERKLVVVPPANPDTSSKNHSINGEIYVWSKQDGTGVGFESSAGFTLPNGAVRSPDASWMSKERWEAVPEDDKLRLSHIAPDFVVELRSPSDSLRTLQDKMAEYLENGVRLGWLIDPFQQRVHVYRPGRDVEVLEAPETVSGENVLPGFVLSLQEIWQPNI